MKQGKFGEMLFHLYCYRIQQTKHLLFIGSQENRAERNLVKPYNPAHMLKGVSSLIREPRDSLACS